MTSGEFLIRDTNIPENSVPVLSSGLAPIP
jgi:hypothetical protein